MSDPGHVARGLSASARAQGAARAAAEREAIARLTELLGMIYRPRDPDGCPWDRAQSVDSMAFNLLEEAAEAHEAVASGDDAAICEELGDTLKNVLPMAHITEQERLGLAWPELARALGDCLAPFVEPR